MFVLDPTLITFSIYIFGMIFNRCPCLLLYKQLSIICLGDRKLGSFEPIHVCWCISMSGWLLMGLPGAVYVSEPG